MYVSEFCPPRTRALRRFVCALVVTISVASRAQPASDSSAGATPGADAPAPDSADKPAPFAFADFTWLTGNPRTTSSPLDTPAFTFEFRVDTSFHYSFAHPADNTISGSSEVFRSGEVQLTMLGVGGDLHWKNVRGRLMTQIGMYSQTTPRNDASTGRGQWNLADAFRYISEGYGGYHFDVLNGLNVDAGIFLSYVGLFSYYQFDNWSYQPSYVSSNTPWFFNGIRIQIFTSDKLKIEPWIVNGWQSYGRFNSTPGIGLQIAWRPNGNLSFVFNQYFGADTLGIKDRLRIHTDDSVQVKYLDTPQNFISKAAFTVTIDVGCEFGGGVSCTGGDSPAQYFVGAMAYHRLWFDHDLFGLTVGLGGIINPGRYLVLLPPINGATALSGTPYFTESPGNEFKAWDTSVTFDWMPIQFFTFRVEYVHRHASILYFAGQGGVTPPGGNTGAPGSFVDGWAPDLRHNEDRVTAAILVKI